MQDTETPGGERIRRRWGGAELYDPFCRILKHQPGEQFHVAVQAELYDPFCRILKHKARVDLALHPLRLVDTG